MNVAWKFIAAALMLTMLLTAFQPVFADRVPGYWDTMDNFTGAEGKDPTLVGFNGKLYNIYQLRTELYNPDGSRLGIRGDLYYSAYNGTNWSEPACITLVNKDVYAHGCHKPWATVYKGRMYVTAEAIEPSIKDDSMPADPNPVNNTDYDIILRVFDGTGWDPPLEKPMHVLNQPADGNVADQECRSIIYHDTLYFIWMQIPSGNTTANERRIAYRTFDGSAWGPIGVASEDLRSIYGDPSLAVFHDRLYVTVQTNSSTDRDMDIVSVNFDGTSWSAPERVNPTVAGYSAKRYNLISRLAVFHDRLWCVWQSRDTVAKSSTALDLMLSSTDGSGWSWPVPVNPGRRSGDDFWPTMTAYNGSLYMAWSSNDPVTTDGQEDNDIVIRSYDGQNWSAITNVSPYGDNGTIGGEHNPGDDNQPFLYSWNGSLYCTWISFDQFERGIGHPGAEFTTIVKLVAGPAGGEGGNGTPPVETSPGAQQTESLWPVAAVLLLAAMVALAIVLVRRPRKEKPAERASAREGKD
jgi:hypothetical protein